MTKKPSLKTTLLGGGVLLAFTAHAELPSSEMLAYTCVGCHGENGVSNGPATPTIAGINEELFVEVMQGYASGEIPSTVMGRIAKGYSEEEIKLLADYFVNKTFVAAEQSSDSGLAKKGAKLHKKYCEKCHSLLDEDVSAEEDDDDEDEDDAGILAGQWTPYLTWTLEDYISGKREMTKKMAKKMKKMRKKHGDEGITQLLHYYASEK